MSLHLQAGSGRQLIQRWQALAERRLDYLTELFESGRWRRYHSELEFLENIQEAKAAVERWQTLARQEVTVENLPVTWSWLDRADQAPAYAGSVLYQEPRKKRAVAVEPVPLQLVASSPSQRVDTPPRAAAVTPAELDWKRALDPAVLSERYPMLRAASI